MNIMDALHLAGVTVKKVSSTKGGEYAGGCPACQGGTDRLRVWPADNGGEGSFWCRRCGKGGDLVQFLVDYCGYDYKEAFLAAGRGYVGGYIPTRYQPACSTMLNANANYEPKKHTDPVKTWQEKAEDFVNVAHHALLEYAHGLDYLASRGITLDSVKKFRLGWHPGERNNPCSFRPRKVWGLPEIKNPKNGRAKMLWLPRGFVIPCYRDGSIHRIKIRRPAADMLTDKDVKYYVVPGSGMEVFSVGSNQAVAVIVEAELDAMLVYQESGKYAGVVALGSVGIRPGSDVYHTLQECLRVLVALDSDDAGFGKTGWQWWRDNFPNAVLWPVPDGKDPGEAWAAGVDIGSWILAGLPAAQRMSAADMGYKLSIGMSSMDELYMLMQQYPVTISATVESIEVLYNPIFKNQVIKQRVQELLAMDDHEIALYLRHFHPDNVITGKNFLVKVGV